MKNTHKGPEAKKSMAFSRNSEEFHSAGSPSDPCFEVNCKEAGSVIGGQKVLEPAGYLKTYGLLD